MSQVNARNCLKCGYVRGSQDEGPPEACPSCGAVYAKVEAALKNRESVPTAKPAVVGEVPYVPEYVDAGRRRLTHVIYLLYLLPTGLTTLMGYSLVKSIRDDHRDEIAAAHNEWQYDTVSRIVYVIAALLLLALVIGAVQGGYWLTHDETLRSLARKCTQVMLVLSGAVYLWVLLRTLRGWLQLLRSEGP